MITAEDLIEQVRSAPFRPFRIHLSDGKSFDVTHPDLALVTRNKVLIGVPSSLGYAQHVEHCALIHIVRIEELQTA